MHSIVQYDNTIFFACGVV